MSTPVIVQAISVDSPPSKPDTNVPGAYLIEIVEDVSKELLADAALDCFHEAVHVEAPNRFQFRALDATGASLMPCLEHKPYTLGKSGRVVRRAPSLEELHIPDQVDEPAGPVPA